MTEIIIALYPNCTVDICNKGLLSYNIEVQWEMILCGDNVYNSIIIAKACESQMHVCVSKK